MGVGGQRPAPATLHTRKRLGTHCTGGWVSPMPVCTGVENLATTGIVGCVYKIIQHNLFKRNPYLVADTDRVRNSCCTEWKMNSVQSGELSTSSDTKGHVIRDQQQSTSRWCLTSSLWSSPNQLSVSRWRTMSVGTESHAGKFTWHHRATPSIRSVCKSFPSHMLCLYCSSCGGLKLH
jgi:hypothetical protein